MKVLVQRSLMSSVSTSDLENSIKKGLVIFVGFTQKDTVKDIEYCINKIVNLRIFDDENGIMNKSVLDIGGEILSISQFTLYANTKKGNRPSYIDALNGDDAQKLYDVFNELLSKHVDVKTGAFGANMLINIQNDGPVTILIESSF